MLRTFSLVALCITLVQLGSGAATAPSLPTSQPATSAASTGPSAAKLADAFAIYVVNAQGPILADWNELAHKENHQPSLLLEPLPLLTEADLISADAQRNVAARQGVNKENDVLVQVTLVLTLSRQGQAKLANFSARAKDQRLAVIYQKKIISAPFVAKKIDQPYVPILLEGFKLEDAKPIADEINRAIAKNRAAFQKK